MDNLLTEWGIPSVPQRDRVSSDGQVSLYSSMHQRGCREVRWYADNSELNGIKDAEIPDILLFGGVIIGADAEADLQLEVERIKKRHGHPRAPVKWNMKDLMELYKRQEQMALYDKLLASSREWRAELFNAIAAADCALLVACIEGYSQKRDVLKRRKENLTRYIFTNGLMRFGLHVKDAKPSHAQVVLDWPDKGISKPFDSEYTHAFELGKTSDGNVTYQCGRLSSLGFSDSVMFTNMPHCQMLQIADLVVGASREFLECCLGKKQGGQGLDCLRTVRDKFRGAPGNIVGWGLVVSSGNAEFRDRVKRGVRETLYGA